MIPFPGGARVWLATGRTDMRKGMNGLALQVQEVLRRDPYSRAEHRLLASQREGGTGRVRRPWAPPSRGGLAPHEVERPATTGGEGGTVPQEVAREAYVLPAQG